MKILLLSAYDAASHRYWRRGLVEQFPEHNWSVLTLPDRYFAWRIRGNSLSWAFGERDVLEAGYDLLIATSMTDLSALRGMVPALAKIPALVYFHENQFAYPLSKQQKHEQVFARTLNLYTALAAERVLFNTTYNRHSFLCGVEDFLRQMPDGIPANLLSLLEEKSAVLPVPLWDDCFATPNRPRPDNTLAILWNHRWEYDKAPERFFLALRKFREHGINFELHIIGQRFRYWPEVFDRARTEFEQNILSWGFVERKSYLGILHRADIVISTALHDFQGIALLEAVASGCIPLAPDRLAYPEFIPERFRYPSFPGEAERETDALCRLLLECSGQLDACRQQLPALTTLGWEQQRAHYKSWLVN